LEKTRSKTGL